MLPFIAMKVIFEPANNSVIGKCAMHTYYNSIHHQDVAF